MSRLFRSRPLPLRPGPRTAVARLAARLRSLSAGGAAPSFALRVRVAGLSCVPIAMRGHDLMEANHG